MLGEMTFENLRVYQAAVLLDELVMALIAVIPPGNYREIDQLKRAIASLRHNIAEAHGCEQPGRKGNHLEIARGSADEVRSILIRFGSCRVLDQRQIDKPCVLARTIAKMLTSWLRTLGRS